MGETDKRASDGVNKLLIENKCNLSSQKELSTDEAKELVDSLNVRVSETSAKNAHNVGGACCSESFDEIEDEAKMLTRQTVNNTNAQDLSYKLKVNEIADLTNTKPMIEEVLSRVRDHARNDTRKPQARKQELAL